jgi:hypothetical protein
MPLYLVRWPDLSAALVKAGSEEELEDMLDEIANPEGCTWSVYRGPLFLEFSLRASIDVKERQPGEPPLEPQDIRVRDVSNLLEGPAVEVSIPEGDTAYEMTEAVEKQAFPHVHKARHSGDGEPSERVLRDAVLAEAQALMRASWRTEQTRRRSDPASRIAAEMGATPRLVQRWIDAAAPKPPPEQGPGRKGRKRR